MVFLSVPLMPKNYNNDLKSDPSIYSQWPEVGSTLTAGQAALGPRAAVCTILQLTSSGTLRHLAPG